MGSESRFFHPGICTVIFQKTLVYDRTREKYGRLRPYTDSVTVDLGMDYLVYPVFFVSMMYSSNFN